MTRTLRSRWTADGGQHLDTVFTMSIVNQPAGKADQPEV